jgi:hypothetical protein
MSLYAPSNGHRVFKPHNLSSTSAVELFKSAEKMMFTLESIYVFCDALGSTLSLWISDGTNDYYLLKAASLTATGPTPITVTEQHIPFASGWSLKAQAGTANQIGLHCVVMQSAPTNADRSSQ